MEDKTKTISLCIALVIIVIADGYIEYPNACVSTETIRCYSNFNGNTQPMNLDKYFAEHNSTPIVYDDNIITELLYK